MDQSLKTLCDAVKKVLAQLKPQHHAVSFLLFIGKRNQGKATLLRQSQLTHYPLEAGGAELYHNQQGIIVELGEDWLNQSKHLLQYTLKQLNRCHRTIRISGIILCVDINELINADPAEIKALIQSHIRLMTRFGTDLGYSVDASIMFTKLDLLPGFCDFFQNDHTTELQKPLGFSLNHYNSSEKIADVFKEQFDHLIETLSQQVISKIHPVRSSIKRTLIREFPLQLLNLRNVILPLIQHISLKLFRLQAIYFTSGEQGGVIFDKLNQKIQQEYALTLHNQFHQSTNYRPYFIEGALLAFQSETKQSIPETSMTHKRIAICLMAGTACSVIWLGSQYIRSAQLLDKASKELIAFDSLNQSSSTDTATFHLTKASRALEAIPSNPMLSPTVQTLKAQLRINAKQQLNKQFLPNVIHDIEQALAEPTQSPIDRYLTLKIYLMLGEREHYVEKEVLAWFEQFWSRHEAPSDVKKKLNVLTQILKHTSEPLALNKQAITDARNFLNALPTSYLYYSLAKSYFPTDSTPLKVGGFVLASDHIPNYFTKSGFQTIIRQLPTIVKQLLAENWILEHQDLTDLPVLLQQAYCYEYVIWWQHFLQQAHPTRAQDYQQIHRLMETMRESSTISTLIELIQQQTSPNSNAGSDVFNQEVASKFSELNLISHSSIHHLMVTLNELEKFVSTLSVVNDQGRTAFNLTKARFQGDVLANPLNALYGQSQQLPQPVATWAKQIADDTWFTLINNSRAYINHQWQQQVYNEYQTTIAHRYPFDLSQTDEISLHDFNQFFSTHGRLHIFIDEYIKPFLDTTKPQWQLKEVNNFVVPISSDMINELMRANVITNMFFPDQSNNSQVEFSLQKVSLDPIVASLQLTIGDTKLRDTQSSDSFTEFSWPQSNARLVVNSIEGQHYELEELGTWAFFKILQKVNVLVDEQDSSNLQIIFEINGNSGRYLLKAQSPVNPFIPGILNEFSLSDVIV